VSYGIDARIDNTGTVVPTYLYNYGDAPAADVTVVFDAGALRDVAISVPDYARGCTLAGAVVTCTHSDLAPGQVDTIYPFMLASKPKATPGPAGTLKATIRGTAPDGTVFAGGGTLDVTIVPTGPDLVAEAPALNSPDHRIGPGETAGIHAALYNDGDTPAEGFYVRLVLPTGARFAKEYKDCTYVDYWPGEHPEGYAYGPSEVMCTAPLTLQPGERLMLFNPDTGESVFTAYFGKNLPGPSETEGYFEVGLIDNVATPSMRALVGKGDGKSFVDAVAALKGKRTAGVAAAREADTSDNVARYKMWTKANTNDFSVSATAVTGAVGDTVEVPYTLVNNGPSDGAAGWQIVAPSGTVLVRGGDRWCYFHDDQGRQVDELRSVRCGTESEWPSKASNAGMVTGKIKVRIVSTPGDDGTLTVKSFGPSRDPNPANDVARLVIDVPAGAGDSLPITGAKTALVGGAGAAAVALGVLFYLLARRRTIIMVTPDE
jgi:hypothetical protein